jgi:hypothetical protein
MVEFFFISDNKWLKHVIKLYKKIIKCIKIQKTKKNVTL